MQVAQARLINDFVAVGYGVLGLSEQDLYTLQPGSPDANAPTAVIGAGTGLGEGRMSTVLEQVPPVHIVLNSDVGLIGAALCAAQLTSS